MAVKRRRPGAGTEPVPATPAAASAATGARDEAPGFAIVGVGASAGGLDAFTQLLQALPVDTGCAFILVPHLAPSHESMLAEILSRTTAMVVSEILQDEGRIEPNRVYVLPANRDLILQGGALRLLPRAESQGQHRTIDRFLRSLAEDRGDRAIGVVT